MPRGSTAGSADAPPPTGRTLVLRDPLTTPSRLTLVDNGKPRARALMGLVADRLGERFEVGAVVDEVAEQLVGDTARVG